MQSSAVLLKENLCGNCLENVFPEGTIQASSGGNRYVHSACGRAWHVACLYSTPAAVTRTFVRCGCGQKINPTEVPPQPSEPLRSQVLRAYDWGYNAAPEIMEKILTHGAYAAGGGVAAYAAAGAGSAAVSAVSDVASAVSDVAGTILGGSVGGAVGVVTGAASAVLGVAGGAVFGGALGGTIGGAAVFGGADAAVFGGGIAAVAAGGGVGAAVGAVFGAVFGTAVCVAADAAGAIGTAAGTAGGKLGEKIGQCRPIRVLCGSSTAVKFLFLNTITGSFQ